MPFLFAAVAIGGIVGFAAWFGVFTSIKIWEQKFDGGLFYYREYQGHIKNIGSHFQAICAQRSKLFGQHDGVSPTGIYYDDPKSLVNQNMMRASTGLLINKPGLVTSQIEQQLQALGFKIAHLPPAMSLYGKFPSKTGLSCVLGAMKFYPKLSKIVAESGEKYSDMKNSASIEVIEGGYVHYYFLTENFKDIPPSSYPRPDSNHSITKGSEDSKKAK